MAVTAHTYPAYLQKMAGATAKPTTDSFRVILLTSYTYANSHATMADVLGAGTEVATGGGYTTGGYQGGLALSSVTATTSGFVFTLTAANPSWSSSTISAAHAVFFASSANGTAATTNATAYPVVHWDFGGTSTSSSSTFTLAINASGLWTVTGS